ncbi:MAG: N-formylglutamate amidohydrolase [Muribaculaceae bacterium]|nr:N-formylglutamate amidohydrolase [Muribaculaceae bacterium]
MNNIVLNIPHSSICGIFDGGKWPHNPHFINKVVRRVTDWFTDFLFYSDNPAVQEVVFPYSRLVCDVTGTDEGSILWPAQGGYKRHELSDSEHAELLDLHQDYNEELKSYINEDSILIEGHSFTGEEVQCDILVGTIDWERNHDIVDIVKHEFEKSGYSVNYLFNEKFAFEPSCKSMFIKVNRRVYMNHSTLTLNPNSRQWMRWFGCLNRIYDKLLGQEYSKTASK